MTWGVDTMEQWIPLFQSLVWPIFIGLVLFLVRGWFRDLLEVIHRQVAAGSPFSVGPSGFSLGSGVKLDEADRDTEQMLLERVDSEISKAASTAQESLSPELAQTVYLVHEATFVRKVGPSTDRRDFYAVRVQLDADSPAILDRVSKVVYYRHPTVTPPVREITDRASGFEMNAQLWGQFNLRADVYFEDSERPLTLYRYLNF